MTNRYHHIFVLLSQLVLTVPNIANFRKGGNHLRIKMKPIPKKKRGGENEPMRNVNLEENELTITAIFQQHTKEETIQTLKEALEVLEQEESDPENEEMIEIINSTVGKLQQIEDKYYYSLDLNYYLNNLEDDAYET